MTQTLTSPTRGTTIHTAQALTELLEQTCTRDTDHLVLHDQHLQVWVACPHPIDGFTLTRPIHPSLIDTAVSASAWLDELTTAAHDFPSWRYPLTVLYVPDRQ